MFNEFYSIMLRLEDRWPTWSWFDDPVSPAFDIQETDNSYILTGEMAGVKPEDVDISLDKNILTIKGEKKKEIVNLKYSERTYGSFSRSWSLNDNMINVDDIDATFKDGILKITISKITKTEKDPKKIEVKTS